MTWSTPLLLQKTSKIPRVRERLLLLAPLRLLCRKQPERRLNLHLGLASASLSSPFGKSEEVLLEKMAHVTVLAAGVVLTPAPGAEKRVLDAHCGVRSQ